MRLCGQSLRRAQTRDLSFRARRVCPPDSISSAPSRSAAGRTRFRNRIGCAVVIALYPKAWRRRTGGPGGVCGCIAHQAGCDGRTERLISHYNSQAPRPPSNLSDVRPWPPRKMRKRGEIARIFEGLGEPLDRWAPVWGLLHLQPPVYCGPFRLHRATPSQMEVAPSDRCWRVPRVIGPVDQRQASSPDRSPELHARGVVPGAPAVPFGGRCDVSKARG
jgi:hypothetical protein